MKATAFPRVAKLLSPFDSATFPPPGAFVTVEPPPRKTVNIFDVFAVRGEGVDGTALRIRNFPHSCHTAPAKQGTATAVAAAVAEAIGVAELPFELDIAEITVLAAAPASAKTDSIIPRPFFNHSAVL